MIYGINPSSLIDYPGEMSFVIFLGGCNFNCPFCHNKDIVNKATTTISEEEVINMLKERTKLISTVTITGGEPTIYNEQLIDLIKKIKNINYKIKLDTNGSNPAIIKKLIDLKLIDFIAMDIKNTFEKYEETIQTKININDIKKSIDYIQNSSIPYEFRTTINKEMHSSLDIEKIMSYIKDITKYKVQPYRFTKQQLTDTKFTEWTTDELKEIESKKKVTT